MPPPPYRVDYHPIIDRPRLTWPNVEHYECLPDFDWVRHPWPRTPYPDGQQYAYRDYGHRVDNFHLLDVIETHGLKATVPMDVLTAAPPAGTGSS